MRYIVIMAAVLALPASALADRPARNSDPSGGIPPGMGASPAAVAAASRPGDEQMTCEQIGAEMQPYAMQMRQSMDSHNIQQDTADMQARNERAQRESQRQAPSLAASMVAGFIPGAGYAQMAAAQAEAARQRRLAEEQRPAQEQFNRDMNGFAEDTSSQMAGNPRIQRLMQLAQEKHCH